MRALHLDFPELYRMSAGDKLELAAMLVASAEFQAKLPGMTETISRLNMAAEVLQQKEEDEG